MEENSKRICLLCKIREANKRNSHILPKFFNDRLFSDGFMYEIDKNGQKRKIQKSPKEDYILCDQCENRIAIVETYCSNHFFHAFHNINSNIKFPLKNEIRGNNCSQLYKEGQYLNPNIFNLFIISLVWRTSISSHKWFSELDIDEKLKEQMRADLNDNLKYSRKEYDYQDCSHKEDNDYYSYEIISKQSTTKNPEGTLSIFNIKKHVIMLNLVDFSVFFFMNEKASEDFRPILNKKSSKIIKVCISDDKIWKNIHNEYKSRIIK